MRKTLLSLGICLFMTGTGTLSAQELQLREDNIDEIVRAMRLHHGRDCRSQHRNYNPI